MKTESAETDRPWAYALAAGTGVLLVCGVFYGALQRWPLRPVHRLPEEPLGNLLPFSPGWTLPYLSMFVLVGLAWFVQRDRASVRRLAVTLLSAEAIAWICFALWPTEYPRPAGPHAYLPYRWLIAVDLPRNCTPCLHSTLTLIAAWAIDREICAARGNGFTRIALWSWAIVVLVSIVLVRQHTSVDVGLGLLLGVAALAFTGTRRSTASKTDLTKPTAG